MRAATNPERIVFAFEHEITEAHRDTIQASLGLTDDQFEAAIPRARDLGTELDPPLRLTPIYERDGWWTCRPTERILAIDVRESLKRSLGGQIRTARVLSGTTLDEFARITASVIQGTFDSYLNDHDKLLEISDKSDYVIGAIDDALPRLFVARPNSDGHTS